MILFEKKPRIVSLVFGNISRFFKWYKPAFQPTFPQKYPFLVLVVNRKGNPVVFHQTLKVSGLAGISECLAEYGFHCPDLAAGKQNQTDRFVYLNHLPWQSQLQVADVSIHHTQQGGDVMGQFSTTAVMLVVNEAEIVLKVNSRAYRSNRTEDVSQELPFGIYFIIV